MKQDFQWGYFVLRLGTGLDLFGHGFIRLFGNFAGFQTWLLGQFEKSMLPAAIVSLGSYIIPSAELVLGVLLLLGFKTRETLLAASLLMLGLIFGSCLIQNWEIVSIQLFYLLIYAVLLTFRTYNFCCLDSDKVI